MENKVLKLKEYLEKYRSDDEGDAWYSKHNHYIVSLINSFDKTECNLLLSEIWEWDEIFLYNLADPFSNIKNPYLDGCYIYCNIFMRISNLEYEEYLIQNIYAVNRIEKNKYPISFYKNLKDKVIKINNLLKNNCFYAVEQINLKIQEESE